MYQMMTTDDLLFEIKQKALTVVDTQDKAVAKAAGIEIVNITDLVLRRWRKANENAEAIRARGGAGPKGNHPL